MTQVLVTLEDEGIACEVVFELCVEACDRGPQHPNDRCAIPTERHLHEGYANVDAEKQVQQQYTFKRNSAHKAPEALVGGTALYLLQNQTARFIFYDYSNNVKGCCLRKAVRQLYRYRISRRGVEVYCFFRKTFPIVSPIGNKFQLLYTLLH